MRRGTLIMALFAALPAFAATDLDFAIRDGQIENHFFRQGRIAAHVALSGGVRPNLIIAFPAGNTGVYAEFSGLDKMTLDPAVKKAGNGVRAVVKTAAKMKTLRFENFVLGNIRHIRDYEGAEKRKPSEINETATLSDPQTLKLERVLTPEHRYSMTVQALGAGQIFKKGKDGHWRIEQKKPSPIEFAVTAETSEPPLTPFSAEQLLKPDVLKAMDPLAVFRLQFLSYREKFLAGSWRYLNFFFRDTALSTRLMFEALQPEAVETALTSIFERMNDKGELAHEEALSDFAYYLSGQKGEGSFLPVLDFKMIDNDFMLAPLVLRYFNSVEPERAKRFLERKLAGGKTIRRSLRVNLVHVLDEAAKFTAEPVARNLVRFKNGEVVGQWRDSEFAFLKEPAVAPFDVNVALVPSALAAASEFFNSDRYGLHESENGRRAAESLKVWSEKAAGLFQMEVPAAKARILAVKFSRSLKIKAPRVDLKQPIKYFAIGLKSNGEPIPVMNSDEAAYLVFGRPTEQQLNEIADRVLLPFPYGLSSSVGILISNTAFADAKTQKFYTRDHYHGLLVWGREQAMFALGLEEQLKRTELSAGTHKKLEEAQAAVWDAIRKTQAYQSRELWTWRAKNGRMMHVPYGQTASHHTSANPIQLWSEAGVVIRTLHEMKTSPSRVAVY
jgi:hypothetical protein